MGERVMSKMEEYEQIGEYKLWPVEDHWVISDKGGWLPGSYKTKEEAIKGADSYIKSIEDKSGEKGL